MQIVPPAAMISTASADLYRKVFSKLKSGSFEPLIRGKGGREKLSGKAMQI